MAPLTLGKHDSELGSGGQLRTRSAWFELSPLEHVGRGRVFAADMCGQRGSGEKLCSLSVAGWGHSGEALVRDLSTQIWITRQRNLARSNLCV